MGILTEDEITKLRDAAILAGLQRQTLLLGVSPMLIARLPVQSTPYDQMLSDLRAMNEEDTALDGPPPLVTWLSNAIMLSGPRATRVFDDALARIRARG